MAAFVLLHTGEMEGNLTEDKAGPTGDRAGKDSRFLTPLFSDESSVPQAVPIVGKPSYPRANLADRTWDPKHAS